MFRTARSALVVAATAIILTGCVPASPPPTATATSTAPVLLEYAPSDSLTGEGHLVHLYLPHRKAGQRVPLIVWTGGNGWLRDDGGDTGAGVAQLFGPEGYAVAGVNLRSSAQATFPAQLTDMQAAIHILRVHADTYAWTRTGSGWRATPPAGGPRSWSRSPSRTVAPPGLPTTTRSALRPRSTR